MKIKKIKKVEKSKKVYNLRIKDIKENEYNHNYFANDILVSNCHKAGSKTSASKGKRKKASGIKQVEKVLKKTFSNASVRFGMSGTFPDDESLDFLTIQSLHGPKIEKVQARELMDKGIISNVKIKSVLLNHNDQNLNNNLNLIKKSGNAKAVYDLEKKYVQESKLRLDFVFDKIISNISKNTLILFHIKDYGKKIYNRIRNDVTSVNAYYIDGDVKKDKREVIKKKLDSKGRASKIGSILGDKNIKDKPKVLVASFGTLATGISIKNIHNVIFMESFKSEQIIIQSIGRILRLHKDKKIATVFDIVDIFDDKTRGKNILYQHYIKRKGFYKKRDYPYSELKINLK